MTVTIRITITITMTRITICMTDSTLVSNQLVPIQLV